MVIRVNGIDVVSVVRGTERRLLYMNGDASGQVKTVVQTRHTSKKSERRAVISGNEQSGNLYKKFYQEVSNVAMGCRYEKRVCI